MKVVVFTSTRAEFGLLRPLIKRLEDDTFFEITLLVTGSHLMSKFGDTLIEIESDFSNLEKVILDQKGDSSKDVANSMAQGLSLFTSTLSNLRPDLLIILGDRYEALSCAISSLLNNIPIAHIHGGELTEGAIDDAFRHSITKMASIHFASTEEYKNRIIQMGENPDQVFNPGALAAENIKNMELIPREILYLELKFDLKDPYFLITYHPETLEGESPGHTVDELIAALEEFEAYKFIITYPNSDPNHEVIVNKWQEFYKKNKENVYLTESLGCLRYLSCMKYASAVIGNSSSGIIEAPIMKVPTVNIGDRQKGRLSSSSIIDVKPSKQAIVDGLRKIQHIDYSIHPYGDENVSQKIVDTLKKFSGKLQVRKSFYDINTN